MGKVNLDAYQAFLFDVDGVLWRGGQAIEGAAATVHRLKAMGKKVACVTNNSAFTSEQMHRALAELGFPFALEEVITAPNATARWLAGDGSEGPNSADSSNSRPRRAFVLGTDSVKQELREHGIAVVEDPEAIEYRCDDLILGGCRHLNYDLLTQALRVALAGARCVAVNRDGIFPGKDGFYPGAGAIIGAIEGMLGREVDVLIGKPSPLLAQMALEQLDVTAQDCLMIGDTIDSDIRMGNAVGMDTLLVLTGNTNSTGGVLSADTKPTYVLPSVVDLRPV